MECRLYHGICTYLYLKEMNFVTSEIIKIMINIKQGRLTERSL